MISPLKKISEARNNNVNNVRVFAVFALSFETISCTGIIVCNQVEICELSVTKKNKKKHTSLKKSI